MARTRVATWKLVMPCQTRLADACHRSAEGFGSHHWKVQLVFQAELMTCLKPTIPVHISVGLPAASTLFSVPLPQLLLMKAQPVPTDPAHDSWSPLAIPGVLMVALADTPHTMPLGEFPLALFGVWTSARPPDRPQLPHFGAPVMLATRSGQVK